MKVYISPIKDEVRRREKERTRIIIIFYVAALNFSGTVR